MILVTGAGGPTGRAVIAAVVRRGLSVRAFVHRRESVAALVAPGGETRTGAGSGAGSGAENEAERAAAGRVEAVVGDLLDADALAAACAGVARVYHICPNFHPAEQAIGAGVLAAARKAGVAQFVYHSVLHPGIEAMPHHWQKLRVEELLHASDLAYSIVQPSVYMQNLTANLGWRRPEGAASASPALVLTLPYALAARISLVHVDDVGEAAARLLETERERGGIYPLVGTPAWSQHEVAEMMTAAFGVEVCAEELPLAEWRRRNARLEPYKHDGLARMFAYYAAHGLAGSTRTLRALLGREPTSLAAWLRDVRPPAAT